ncbi:phage tail tape measure protein [Halomonas elongata]|uniref:phage tail tape measure protein n=1 Tax=Halomonas elongata TaxID=2746 RepID=UPI0023AF8722|nr:phage tail tape measure protein [Halomonas elongata]
MARDLKLQVVLNAVNNATKPLRKITEGSEKTAEALKASRQQLKQLERAQKDLKAFKAMKRQASESGNALKEQQERVKALSQQIRHTEGDTAALNRERDQAIKKARELSRKYSDQTDKARRLRQGLRETHGMTGKLSDAERELGRKVRSTTDDIDQQRQKLGRLADAQRQAQRAADQYQRGIGRANNMRSAGMTGLATGGAALYGGARMLTPGVAWGEQMSAVQAVGRFEDDDPRLKALKQQSRELGGSTAFSANEVGAGQEFLLRAGMSAEAIKSSMGDVLDLAIANNTELGRTADIASNIAGTFKIDLEQDGAMTRVADILSATASRANVDLEKLGNTVKYLGGVEGLDITLEQASAMAGMLGNVGIQGSQAGTTMRAMMNRLTEPTAEAAGIIDQLGIKVADAQGNMRAMPEILRDLNDATKELGNVERKAALQKIFGAEAGSGMAELVSQMSTGALDELIAKLEVAAGENARMARTMEDNIGGDLKSLNSAWQEIGITLTDTNEGPLRDLIQNVTAITRAVGEWMKANPELTAQLATAAAGIAGLVAVGGALTIMVASLLGPIVTVRYGLAMLGIQTGGLGGKIYAFTSRILPALGKGLLWVGRIMATVGRALLLNPIGLVVTAIAGAALLIYKYWQPISAFFSGVFKEIREAFAPLVAAIQPAFAALGKVLEPLAPVWNTVADALGAVWQWVTNLLSPMKATGEQLDSATSAGQRFGKWLVNIVTFFPRLVASFAGLGIDLMQGLFGNLKRGLAAGWQEVRTAFDGGLTGVIHLLIDWSPFGMLWRGITATLDKLGVQVPQRFSSLGAAIIDGLIGGIGNMLGTLRQKITGMARSVISWFKGVLGINSPSRVFTGFGGDIVQGIINGIANLVGSLREKVVGLASSIAGWMKNAIGSAAATGREIAGNIGQGVKDGAKAAWNATKGAAAGTLQAGKDVARGLGDGIRQGAGAVAGQAGEMADGIVAFARDKLDINSPSRVFRDIGGQVMEGLRQGLAAGEKSPLRQIDRFGDQLRRAGAGLTLGALTLPNVATATPPVPPELPAQRVAVDAPALPDLGTLQAPRIEAPHLPELPALQVATDAPTLPDLGTLQAPRIETPALPELPALQMLADAPALPELGTLQAPDIQLPRLTEMPALRVTADAPTLPDLGTLQAPHIETPALPELPALQMLADGPTLPDLGTLQAPGIQLPRLPEMPALRVAADAPTLPNLGTLQAPGIEVPRLPEMPALRVAADAPTLPDLGTLQSPRIELPRLPELPALKVTAESPTLPQLGELPSLRIRPPQLDTMPALAIQRPELPDLGSVPYQRPDLSGLQVARPEVPPIEADTQPIQIDNRPPLTAGGMNAGTGGVSMGDININVNAAPGMDEQQLAQHVAREVQRALDDAQRDASARGRSSLWDRE